MKIRGCGSWIVVNSAARWSLQYLAHHRQPTNAISFLFSTLDIYTLGFFPLKSRNWVHSTFLYTQDFVFPQHVLHKHVLGGGIYLRKLPALSLLARTFWVTFVWGPLESPKGVCPPGSRSVVTLTLLRRLCHLAEFFFSFFHSINKYLLCLVYTWQ